MRAGGFPAFSPEPPDDGPDTGRPEPEKHDLGVGEAYPSGVAHEPQVSGAELTRVAGDLRRAEGLAKLALQLGGHDGSIARAARPTQELDSCMALTLTCYTWQSTMQIW